MPTVLRIGPYRFHFYSRENFEPPHIHISRDDFECKFWLDTLQIATNHGFPGHELNKLATLVLEHHKTLLSAWKTFHA